MIIISLCLFCGQAALAQPVERTALNRVVVGSIPTGGAFSPLGPYIKVTIHFIVRYFERVWPSG